MLKLASTQTIREVAQFKPWSLRCLSKRRQSIHLSANWNGWNQSVQGLLF